MKVNPVSYALMFVAQKTWEVANWFGHPEAGERVARKIQQLAIQIRYVVGW